MPVETIHLTAKNYQTLYQVVEEDGFYGLKAIELLNSEPIRQQIYSCLTSDFAEIERIQHLLTENDVFFIHAREILEELGYQF